jgi:hypothetical protein
MGHRLLALLNMVDFNISLRFVKAKYGMGFMKLEYPAKNGLLAEICYTQSTQVA